MRKNYEIKSCLMVNACVLESSVSTAFCKRPARILHPEHCRFRIGEVSKAWAVRSTKEFWHLAIKVFADEGRDRTVCVHDHKRPSSDSQVPPDRACIPDELVNVPTIDQLCASRDALEGTRPEYKRVPAFGCLNPQPDAAVLRVLEKQVPFERLDISIIAGVERHNPSFAAKEIERGKRDEKAAAVLGISLRLRDGPRVWSRSDVEVRHILVAERLSGEKACVRSMRTVHAPARDVASDGAVRHSRGNQENGADHNPAALEEVAKFRQSFRCGTPGESCQHPGPKPTTAPRKAT